jgi:hypothetical protein
MKTLGHSASLDPLLELGAGDAAFQADIKLRARGSLGDVPQLGLGFTAEFGRFDRRGMNLKRELVLRIQNLNEQGKPPAWGLGLAQEVGCVILHEPAQVFAGERPVRDDARVTRPVADFP